MLPSPDTLGAPADRVRNAVATLIKRALAQEVEVAAPEHAWREDGDLRWGALITDAGRTAIKVEPEEPAAGADETIAGEVAEPAAAAAAATVSEPDIPAPASLDLPDPEQSVEPVPVPADESRQTKAALVLELLRREQGAALAELVEATSWLPHTTRAALTGFRKKATRSRGASAATQPPMRLRALPNMARLDEQLTRLATMSPAELRAELERITGAPPPRLSPDLLRMGLAHAMQVKADGKLPARYARQLDRAAEGAAAAAPALSPGTQLVRSWNGRTISVTAVAGGYEWDGELHRSLSAIARAVTGTSWSGPRFFGLTDRG